MRNKLIIRVFEKHTPVPEIFIFFLPFKNNSNITRSITATLFCLHSLGLAFTLSFLFCLVLIVLFIFLTGVQTLF